MKENKLLAIAIIIGMIGISIFQAEILGCVELGDLCFTPSSCCGKLKCRYERVASWTCQK